MEKIKLLILELKKSKILYISLLYANAKLNDILTLNESTENKTYKCYANNPSDGTLIMLSKEYILSEYSSLLKSLKTEDNEANRNAFIPYNIKGNAHFLRTRVLNKVVELIKDNLTRDEIAKLHELNWFQLLYVLRNNASHNDNKDKTINFPTWPWLNTSYPETINWKTISIKNGQLGHTIRYNDKEIIDLIQTAIDYFEKNS